jgi:hypothetical protein
MLKARRRVKAGVPISQFVDRTIRRPEPPAESFAYGQVDARERRRLGFGSLVHYLGFDLVAEVRDQAGPLAVEIAGLLSEQSFWDPRAKEIGQDGLHFPGFAVVRVATAVYQARADLVAAMAPRVCGEARERLSALVASPAFTQPVEVDNDLLRTGYWIDGLVASAEPLSTDLAALVAAQPAELISPLDQAISAALRGSDGWGFDHRVRELAEQIPRLRKEQQVHRRHAAEEAERVAAAEAGQTREALRQLGLS